jgi:hypothetical protein
MSQIKWHPDDDYSGLVDETQYWTEEEWEKHFQEQDKRAGAINRKTKDKSSDYKEQYIGAQPFICSEKTNLFTGVESHWLACDSSDEYPTFEIESSITFDYQYQTPDPTQLTLANLPVYQLALSLSSDFSKFILSHMENGKELPEIHQINSHFFQIQSNIASGHLLGFGREGLPGNIARIKRALSSIQRCVTALVSMKKKNLDNDERLDNLSQKLIVLRDELIKYVYELRSFAWWE